MADRSRRRVIVLGADGMDPAVVAELLQAGKLPNFERLAARGGPYRLGTSYPCASPVAWSSFISSKNPGGHGIYDFLERDRQTYMPRLALSEVRKGLFGIPKVTSKRGGGAFWEEAGKAGLRTSLLFLPVTFPAPKIAGKVHSGLGTPDLRGSWGTYTWYSTRLAASEETIMGGLLMPLTLRSGQAATSLEGPMGRTLDLQFIRCSREGLEGAVIEVGGKSQFVAEGQFSDWFEVGFRVLGPFRAWGICRFLVLEASDHLEVYCSPINLHPSRSPLPISTPKSFSRELFSRHGPYKTLGWDMDTWALEEGHLTEAGFLADLAETVEKRSTIILDEIRNGDFDLLVGVLQDTDLVQHVFWRYRKGQDGPEECRQAITNVHVEIDGILGKALDMLGENDSLFLMSDHGFGGFHRGVNINSFLRDSDFLAATGEQQPVAKVGSIAPGRQPRVVIDWAGTKAYSYGLGNIWLNVRGREALGRVDEGRDYIRLREQIAERLLELRDPVTDQKAVRSVYFREKVYSGPYFENAPDMLVGFDEGFRASWDTALGGLSPDVFLPNAGRWQGDHCSRDPEITPGVLLATQRLSIQTPHLVDMAPTILTLLGCPIPADYEGKSLL